jgi:hypothetical protein
MDSAIPFLHNLTEIIGMKLSRKQVLVALAISAGLSTQLVRADTQGFAPDRSYADPAAPVATAAKARASDFAPDRSYADPAAPAATGDGAGAPGFSPKKSYADPAAPAAS